MAGLSNKLAAKTTALGAGPLAGAAPIQAGAPLPEPMRLLEIDPRRIEPNPDQPRKEYDQPALEALAASIREHGVLEPLVVRLEAGRVILIAGERRQRAAIMAERARVPCVTSDGDPAILALIENLHRQDLTPMEEAEALARLQGQRGYGLAELAAIAGKAVSTVSEVLSLACLPRQVKEAAAVQPARFPRRLLVEMAKEDPSRAVVLAQNAASGQEVRAEDVRAQRRERKAQHKAAPAPAPRLPARLPSEINSQTARVDELFRRAEALAGELVGINLASLNFRQRAYARHSLQPMARALDRLFGHLKKTAQEDAHRWTQERRARLLALVRDKGISEARITLGREINPDGQPLHPSEAAAQLTQARQEALA